MLANLRLTWKALKILLRSDAAFIVLTKNRSGVYDIEEMGALTIDRKL